jgi:hypothetical protein
VVSSERDDEESAHWRNEDDQGIEVDNKKSLKEKKIK